MADACWEDGHWGTWAVGLTITPDMVLRAVWEEPKSNLGGHYAITPTAQGARVIRAAAWRGWPLVVCVHPVVATGQTGPFQDSGSTPGGCEGLAPVAVGRR